MSKKFYLLTFSTETGQQIFAFVLLLDRISPSAATQTLMFLVLNHLFSNYNQLLLMSLSCGLVYTAY